MNPLSNYLRKPEIYVKLPSGGRWWPADSLETPPNGEFAVLAMNGHDDLAMRNADGLMNGASSVAVIQSCVPGIKNAWVGPNMDIEYLFVAIRIASYGNEPFNCYRHADLPQALQGVPAARLAPGSTGWRSERARLDDPDLLRRTAEGLIPVVWWGDVHLTRDNALLAVVYPNRIDGPDSAFGHCGCYRSDDQGHSWQIQSRLLYRPDKVADPHAFNRAGFAEPASIVLPDGEILAVLRTTDGLGDGPLYMSRSSDTGVSWSQPQAIRENGVLPRLLRLANGVLVMSTGRPGADLSFSFDGRGETWSERLPLVPVVGPGNQDDSCGYTSLLALDDNTFLVTYSWFMKPAGDGHTRKAIYVRRVQVLSPAKS